MAFEGQLNSKGDFEARLLPPVRKLPKRQMLRFWLRVDFIIGWLAVKVVIPALRLIRLPALRRDAQTGARVIRWLKLPIMMAYGELQVQVWNGTLGEWTDYGIIARRVITNAGVTFLRDDWNASAQVFANMNFHGIGTGTNAENVTDTALQTESTTALNPNNTRATGTRSTPASNQFRSVGTLTCDADIACTEHGLFDQSATGGGTLWDRSVFSVINLIGANPDSIQCTYTGTLAAGG